MTTLIQLAEIASARTPEQPREYKKMVSSFQKKKKKGNGKKWVHPSQFVGYVFEILRERERERDIRMCVACAIREAFSFPISVKGAVLW